MDPWISYQIYLYNFDNYLFIYYTMLDNVGQCWTFVTNIRKVRNTGTNTRRQYDKRCDVYLFDVLINNQLSKPFTEIKNIIY